MGEGAVADRVLGTASNGKPSCIKVRELCVTNACRLVLLAAGCMWALSCARSCSHGAPQEHPSHADTSESRQDTKADEAAIEALTTGDYPPHNGAESASPAERNPTPSRFGGAASEPDKARPSREHRTPCGGHLYWVNGVAASSTPASSSASGGVPSMSPSPV